MDKCARVISVSLDMQKHCMLVTENLKSTIFLKTGVNQNTQAASVSHQM